VGKPQGTEAGWNVDRLGSRYAGRVFYFSGLKTDGGNLVYLPPGGFYD
jgi:hypothetical protein